MMCSSLIRAFSSILFFFRRFEWLRLYVEPIECISSFGIHQLAKVFSFVMIVVMIRLTLILTTIRNTIIVCIRIGAPMLMLYAFYSISRKISYWAFHRKRRSSSTSTLLKKLIYWVTHLVAHFRVPQRLRFWPTRTKLRFFAES